MKVAQSKTRDKFPLSTRKIWKKTVAATMIWSIFAIIGLIFSSYIGRTSTDASPVTTYVNFGILGFLFVIFLLNYLYQCWYFAVYFYDLTDDYIIIKKGPITPQEITIPYERIQDVYVDQDLLDRIFGIYDVYLSSATVSSGMAAHIDGVEKTATNGLRALLLETVSKRISKAKKK